MYKYGKLLMKVEQIPKNEIEGQRYIKLAAEQDYTKDLYILFSNINEK